MAKFTGSLQDFYILVGPKIRNDVASITKKKKNELNNICQKCNEHEELEAAHIHGRARKDIIQIVLENYKLDNGLYSISNLHKVIREIKAEHIPIEKNFLFLCKKCHQEYDSWIRDPNNKSQEPLFNKTTSNKISQTKNTVNLIKENNLPKEILCKIKKNSWKYKLGWTSIQNRKNIKELILKIETNLDCNHLAFKSWYFHKRSDSNKQFSGIICFKNHSLLCFRILPTLFDIDDDRIIRDKRWFFSEGKEGRVEIIPENQDLIMKCLSHAYDIS